MAVTSYRVLLFDVMGTVVDVEGSLRRETTAVLGRAGLDQADIDHVLSESAERLRTSMTDISAQRRDWQRHRALRSASVKDSLAALRLPDLDPEAESEIAAVTDHLAPWPDSAAALERLRRLAVTVALSNADIAELVAMSAFGGLSWHAALSAELVRVFKPDPGVYRMALQLLAVRPQEVLMVAAHPWDLRAAAELGLATAFIDRPDADQPRPDDHFDLAARDLAQLADRLEPA